MTGARESTCRLPLPARAMGWDAACRLLVPPTGPDPSPVGRLLEAPGG